MTGTGPCLPGESSDTEVFSTSHLSLDDSPLDSINPSGSIDISAPLNLNVTFEVFVAVSAVVVDVVVVIDDPVCGASCNVFVDNVVRFFLFQVFTAWKAPRVQPHSQGCLEDCVRQATTVRGAPAYRYPARLELSGTRLEGRAHMTVPHVLRVSWG